MSVETLRYEALKATNGKSQKWRWIRYQGVCLQNLMLQADGTASADGVDEATALQAIIDANSRRNQRRSIAAKRAATTRAKRRQVRLYGVVKQHMSDGKFPSALHCRICGRGLSDAESKARGIGSECWAEVLNLIAEQMGAA